jgi:hypothetical protein
MKPVIYVEISVYIMSYFTGLVFSVCAQWLSGGVPSSLKKEKIEKPVHSIIPS